MRKYKTVLIIIFIISAGLSLLQPNYGMDTKTLVMPGAFAFVLWSIILFVALSIAFFAVKGNGNDKAIIWINILLSQNVSLINKRWFAWLRF